MKDKRIFIKIEGEKKDKFFKAAKKKGTTSTEILTKRIDQIIEAEARFKFKEKYFNV